MRIKMPLLFSCHPSADYVCPLHCHPSACLQAVQGSPTPRAYLALTRSLNFAPLRAMTLKTESLFSVVIPRLACKPSRDLTPQRLTHLMRPSPHFAVVITVFLAAAALFSRSSSLICKTCLNISFLFSKSSAYIKTFPPHKRANSSR